MDTSNISSPRELDGGPNFYQNVRVPIMQRMQDNLSTLVLGTKPITETSTDSLPSLLLDFSPESLVRVLVFFFYLIGKTNF